MAGAGFKTFNTGDVLTASDVNTYLMQQTVMVFADASARSTALGANVAEGMLSYLKDTNTTAYYDGSSWVTLSTGGDITGVTAGTGLTGGGTSGAVTLDFDVANYGGGQWAAGKNKIINGDFYINQRNFTSESNGSNFVADRWKYSGSTTATASINTFTAGTAPVAGYEGRNFLRMVTSGQSGAAAVAQFTTRVEDVRTFAGQTTTLSFWAKASSGTPFVAANWLQLFGTGGSSTVIGTGQKTAITTSWARYSFTFAIDSVAGKTISTLNDSSVQIEIFTSAGTDYNARTASMGIQSATIDIWGVQWEAGSVATAFQTATGTIQGELAACQRYYWRFGGDAAYQYLAFGSASSTTQANILFKNPVTMRVVPTSIDYSTLALYDGGTVSAATNVTIQTGAKDSSNLQVTVASGLTNVRPYFLISNNSTNGYIGLSAEL